jgi:hypothetical protein
VNHIPNVQDLERTHGVTWGQLAGLEPRLDELLWQARAAGAGCRGWEDVGRLFAPFRDRLAELVGFQGRQSRHPVLGSVGAYEVAYWQLHDAIAGLLPGPGVKDAAEVTRTPLAETPPARRGRPADRLRLFFFRRRFFAGNASRPRQLTASGDEPSSS